MIWWTTLKAAARFLTGPDADEAEQWRRAAICAACPNLRIYEETIEIAGGLFTVPPYTGFCGTERRPNKRRGTCGCGVLAETKGPTPITVEGRPMAPAMKTVKEREWCRRWGQGAR